MDTACTQSIASKNNTAYSMLPRCNDNDRHLAYHCLDLDVMQHIFSYLDYRDALSQIQHGYNSQQENSPPLHDSHHSDPHTICRCHGHCTTEETHNLDPIVTHLAVLHHNDRDNDPFIVASPTTPQSDRPSPSCQFFKAPPSFWLLRLFGTYRHGPSADQRIRFFMYSSLSCLSDGIPLPIYQGQCCVCNIASVPSFLITHPFYHRVLPPQMLSSIHITQRTKWKIYGCECWPLVVNIQALASCTAPIQWHVNTTVGDCDSAVLASAVTNVLPLILDGCIRDGIATDGKAREDRIGNHANRRTTMDHIKRRWILDLYLSDNILTPYIDKCARDAQWRHRYEQCTSLELHVHLTCHGSRMRRQMDPHLLTLLQKHITKLTIEFSTLQVLQARATFPGDWHFVNCLLGLSSLRSLSIDFDDTSRHGYTLRQMVLLGIMLRHYQSQLTSLSIDGWPQWEDNDSDNSVNDTDATPICAQCYTCSPLCSSNVLHKNGTASEMDNDDHQNCQQQQQEKDYSLSRDAESIYSPSHHDNTTAHFSPSSATTTTMTSSLPASSRIFITSWTGYDALSMPPTIKCRYGTCTPRAYSWSTPWTLRNAHQRLIDELPAGLRRFCLSNFDGRVCTAIPWHRFCQLQLDLEYISEREKIAIASVYPFLRVNHSMSCHTSSSSPFHVTATNSMITSETGDCHPRHSAVCRLWIDCPIRSLRLALFCNEIFLLQESLRAASLSHLSVHQDDNAYSLYNRATAALPITIHCILEEHPIHVTSTPPTTLLLYLKGVVFEAIATMKQCPHIDRIEIRTYNTAKLSNESHSNWLKDEWIQDACDQMRTLFPLQVTIWYCDDPSNDKYRYLVIQNRHVHTP